MNPCRWLPEIVTIAQRRRHSMLTAVHFGSRKSFLIAIVDSKKMDHRRRRIYAGLAVLPALGLEDGHVETFWLLL